MRAAALVAALCAEVTNDHHDRKEVTVNMTAKEMARMIGKEFLLTEGPFTIRVLVDDVKVSYGNRRAYVAPVGGAGWAWVNADRLEEDPY